MWLQKIFYLNDFFLKVMPLPHIVPRRGWKSCNALANHSNGVGVHSKKHILLPRGSIPCNNGSNNLTPSQFKPKFKISGSINHNSIKDSSMWKKIQKVKWNWTIVHFWKIDLGPDFLGKKLSCSLKFFSHENCNFANIQFLIDRIDRSAGCFFFIWL